MAHGKPAQAAVALSKRKTRKRPPPPKLASRAPRSTPHSLIERDASAYLGWSIAWLRRGRQRGDGPAFIRVNRTIRYRVKDLDRWLAAHRVEPRGPEAA